MNILYKIYKIKWTYKAETIKNIFDLMRVSFLLQNINITVTRATPVPLADAAV